MSIGEGILGGLASAAGSDYTAGLLAKRKADRKALSDEELHNKSSLIMNDVQNLMQRRSQLPAGSPELANIDKALADHQKAFTDLYHPNQNPDNFSRLSGFLKKHLGGKQAPVQSNAVTPERMASLTASAAGTQAPDPYLTPEELKKKARIAAGLDPRATAEKEVPTKYQPQLTETTDAQGGKHYWRVPLEAGASPEEVNFQGQSVVPKGTGKPVRAWKKDASGKITSVLLDPATNKPIPGSENSDILPPASMTGRVSTGFYHFVDDNGQVHQVEETRTSMPAGQGGGTPAKTPGEAKNRIKAAAGGAAKAAGSDHVIGQKETPVQAKAHNTYVTAYQLAQKADQVAQNPNDAVNQKRLAVALERIAAGRFTTQALDYIIKAGWGNTIEQWANNPSTGALPADVMRQLIDGAHQERDSAYSAWQESKKGASDANDDDKFLMKVK